MNLYTDAFALMRSSPIAPWTDHLEERTAAVFGGTRWGDLPMWLETRTALPDLVADRTDFTGPVVTAGSPQQTDDSTREEMRGLLKRLGPWRKGPYELFGLLLDAEWRCEMKWDRLQPHIAPLDGRLVLDVGCGNGYHCWRMAGEGARLVLGVDPTMKYVMQFHMIQRYAGHPSVTVLPVGVEDLPIGMGCWDTVFSMGLLYHRREPDQHLQHLMSCLRPGGELVLETIVVDAAITDVLRPGDRYAEMKNVHMIPSVPLLEQWVAAAGFENIRTVDVTPTTSAEQRVTDWIGQKSLSDFLDPADPTLTVEGHPAPRRAILLAVRP